MKFDNRVTQMLGVEYPIVQAPMGWIARSALASAVSNAGGLGIIETSSGELDAVKAEIKKMKLLTQKPFGVNIAQAFVKDPDIAQFVIDQGVTFVTTSAGSPTRYTDQLKRAGLTVFHVVPTLTAALKAVAAGVDGLIVEGGEGGGFKSPNEVASMVLLPLVRSKVDVPIIAPEAWSMAAPWRRRLPWARKASKWVPVWFQRLSPPYIKTGSKRLSMHPKLAQSSSTNSTHQPLEPLEPSEHRALKPMRLTTSCPNSAMRKRSILAATWRRQSHCRARSRAELKALNR